MDQYSTLKNDHILIYVDKYMFLQFNSDEQDIQTTCIIFKDYHLTSQQCRRGHFSTLKCDPIYNGLHNLT